MSKSERNIAVFVSFCIEQYAKAKGITTDEAASLLEQYGITQHFCEFYDVLHTQGGNWLVEEIDDIINRRKR